MRGGAKTSKPLGVEAWHQPEGVWLELKGQKQGPREKGGLRWGGQAQARTAQEVDLRSREWKEGQKS